MAKVTGSINLGTTRIIAGVVPLKGRFSVQMNSADLSANTDLTLQFSLDKTYWDAAQEAGTDVTDTLVAATPLVKSFESDPSLYWRIVFSGATTGTVNYIIN